MKFKIASVLELIIPLSVAVILAVFSGCGGGGGSTYGNVAYDGTWTLDYLGFTKPDAATTGALVTCAASTTTIVISHGAGHTTEIITCQNALTNNWAADIDVLITPAASGITATMQATVSGGGYDSAGYCMDRNVCASTGLKITMIKQ
jgi:hypothetical protein